MQPTTKSVLIGILLVLATAFLGGVGIAVAELRPFGSILSYVSSIGLIGSAFIAWGWACFARKELYE